METAVILNRRISGPEFSFGFCERCRVMGYGTLAEIIATPPAEIMAKKGFTYDWLAELSEFLDKNGLLYLLQPIPGRRYD